MRSTPPEDSVDFLPHVMGVLIVNRSVHIGASLGVMVERRSERAFRAAHRKVARCGGLGVGTVRW